MISRKLKIFLALTAIVICVATTALLPIPRVTLFVNGHVITMDENNTVVQAVAVRKGRIIAAGKDEDVLKLKGVCARVVDLNGRTMLPGFVDAHSHFPGSGLDQIMVDLNSPPIGRIRNIKDLKAALSKEVLESGKNDWVVGFGYDDTLLDEKRHPTRADLDEISATQPIWIIHISGHLCVANSKTLAIVGINKDTKNPKGGVIQRDPESGVPNGILEEKAVNMVQKKYPTPSVFKLIKVIKDSISDYSSKGVTTAQNGLAEKLYITALSIYSRLGGIPLRLVVWPDEEVGRKIVEGSFKVKKYNRERFNVGAVKLIADGSIQGYTGYLSEPYHVPPSPDKPDYRGYPVIPRNDLVEKVKFFHRAGLQIAIHGNGDACIDDILYAFEEAQKAFPRKDTRHIVVHAQMARDDQLDRMKALGVTPSFFSLHTYYWGDRHMNIFMGPDRARRMSPAKSAIDRGVRFTIHTDSPVVPMDPLLLTWAAVNRISYKGTPIGEDQRITPTQALRAVTIDAAWQVFLDDTRGSIEVNKFADLVILSDNPLKNPENIRNIKVLETIVGGKTVYKAK